MKLVDFLERKEWTRTYLAWKLNVSEVAVTRYLNGSRLPNPKTMARIYRVTGGKVQPNDFYDLGRQKAVGDA